MSKGLPLGVSIFVVAALIFGAGSWTRKHFAEDTKPVTVNVPDTVRVCDTVHVIDSMLPAYKRHDAAYWLDGEMVRRVKWRVTVERWRNGDSIMYEDGAYIKWTGGWERAELSDFYPDSLSACRALRERWETEKRKIEDKLEGMECK